MRERLTNRFAACAVTAAACFLVGASGALASTPGEAHSWARLEDGKYGFFDDKGVLLDEYTAAQKAEIDRRITALEVDSGTTGQGGSIVQDTTAPDREAAQRMLDKLRTGRVYGTAGEAAVGDEVVAGAEAAGSLPALSAVATGIGTVGAVAGVAYLGVKIGDTFDELFGLPTLEQAVAGEGEGEGFSWGYYSFDNEWGKEYSLHEGGVCSSMFGHLRSPAFDLNSSGSCVGVATNLATTRYRNEVGHERRIFVETVNGEAGPLFGPVNDEGILLGTGAKLGQNHSWSYKVGLGPEGREGATFLHVRGEGGYRGHGCEGKTVCRVGFPATPVVTPPAEAPTELPHQPAIPTPLPAPDSTEIAVPLPAWVAHESPDITPAKGPAPSDPTRPEIPTVEPSELYTHYKTRVETNGFTNVVEHVLPEALIDTSLGPNEVTSVSPSPGTRADPGTEVDVNVNPADAPVPAEGGGGIAPPTVPAVKLPHVATPCSVFPFGIPCWLVDQLKRLEATAAAPKVELTVLGKPWVINLAVGEPVMEVLRPVFLFVSVIGLVLLFGRFARPGTPDAAAGGSE